MGLLGLVGAVLTAPIKVLEGEAREGVVDILEEIEATLI